MIFSKTPRIIFITYLIILSYLAIGCAFMFDFNAISLYNHMADAFIHGQLHMRILPPEELLSLENPFDPLQNLEYRAHGYNDFALFNNKFYLYFGPAPVLTLYIPLKVLAGIRLTSPLAVLIFLAGQLIFSVLLLRHLQEKYYPKLSGWIFTVSILVIGLANTAPYLMSFAMAYQVAIAAAMFFQIGAIYFICIAFANKKVNQKYLLLGSLFLSLAICSRYIYVFCCIIIPILLFKIWKDNKSEKATFTKSLITLLTPLIIFGSLMCTYNYLRFGNIFDVGGKYQLATLDLNGKYFFGFDNFLPSLEYYLFKPLKYMPKYPYIFANAPRIRPDMYDDPGPMVGLIHFAPFALLILFVFIIPKLQSLAKNKEESNFPWFHFYLIVTPGIALFLFLCCWEIVFLRYMSDFLTLFLMGACLVWWHLSIILSTYKIKYAVNSLANLLAIYSIFIGIVISLTCGHNGYSRYRHQCSTINFYALETMKSNHYKMSQIWSVMYPHKSIYNINYSNCKK